MRLTRRYRFSASHRLHAPALDERATGRSTGSATTRMGTGTTIRWRWSSRANPRGDRAADRAGGVGSLVESGILKAMDRRDLNSEVEEFGKLVPTTENLAAVVAARLADAWPGAFAGSAARLEKVRIHETKRNIFEVHGPPGAAGDSPSRSRRGTQIEANQ